jgi:hypothetical protein
VNDDSSTASHLDGCFLGCPTGRVSAVGEQNHQAARTIDGGKADGGLRGVSQRCPAFCDRPTE